MLKLFVSLPMNGLTESSIRKRLEWCHQYVQSKIGDEVEVIDTYITEKIPDDVKNEGVWFMAKSIELLATADIVYFDHGWERARGCRFEHELALKYGLNVLNP